jgi:uncharacterized protein YdcH (DUF465 family)
MIDKKEFFAKLYESISDAIKQCDEGNVIDLRLFKNGNCLGDGVFSIFEGEELYNAVKDCKEWFVDFYENIKDANSAEFIDIVLHSNEFSKKKDFAPMFDKYDQLSLTANKAEDNRRRYVAEIIENIQKEYHTDCIKFSDETTYPTFYDNTTNEMDTIVGAKAVDGVLFLTTDATFSPMCWFDWTHYGELELDEFVYILQHNLA